MRDSSPRSISILGTRGVPASHGGFETFAQHLALHLVDQGWDVTVYCQDEGRGALVVDDWKGVRRVRISVPGSGALSTVVFDAKATLHAAKVGKPCLVLGYNTAIFNALLRIRGVPQVINMDGIEWKRRKWGLTAKFWFWCNEIAGAWIGNHLVADHPEIARHLSRHSNPKRITMIPYGAFTPGDVGLEVLRRVGIREENYSIVVARPEPENSILEIVKAFSGRRRGHTLVVLGNFDASNRYHAEVLAAASDEVKFPGAIYDLAEIGALRKCARFYFHGHQVGGTNPSLVEAMGAGCAVIAHENRFNRWVAGEKALYFANEERLTELLDVVIDDVELARRGGIWSSEQFHERFTWSAVLESYEELLSRFQLQPERRA